VRDENAKFTIELNQMKFVCQIMHNETASLESTGSPCVRFIRGKHFRSTPDVIRPTSKDQMELKHHPKSSEISTVRNLCEHTVEQNRMENYTILKTFGYF
jgi:hypothetical protein